MGQENTYDLAATGAGTGQNLGAPVDLALLVGEVAADKVVDRQLDGLFRRDADELRQNTRVETPEALVTEHLLEAVDGVLVQALAGLRAALVL